MKPLPDFQRRLALTVPKAADNSPARRLLQLVAHHETQDEAQRLLFAAFARLERWAWDLLFRPPPLPTFVCRDGTELKPFGLELPDSPGWRVLAEHLVEVARENPRRPPAALLRAVGPPLADMYGH